jgi:hypothetical protein
VSARRSVLGAKDAKYENIFGVEEPLAAKVDGLDHA